MFSQQTKRKLDEANKRLEALYDKLREQTVSDAGEADQRSDEDLKTVSPSPLLLLLLSALSRHHRRPPQHRPEYRVQVLHGGPQHPHPHSQQQQLQRDVGVHARPQSRADAGKQTRSLIGGLWRVPTGPTGSSFTGRNDLRCTKITFYFFYVPFHVF